MVFIRFLGHSKGYVMFDEYPNGGITEVNSPNVNVLKDEFPSVDEIKQDLLNSELSLDDGEIMNPYQVTKDRTHVLQRDIKNLSVP